MVVSNFLAAVNAPENVTDDLLALRIPLALEMGMLESMYLLVIVLTAL